MPYRYRNFRCGCVLVHGHYNLCRVCTMHSRRCALIQRHEQLESSPPHDSRLLPFSPLMEAASFNSTVQLVCRKISLPDTRALEASWRRIIASRGRLSRNCATRGCRLRKFAGFLKTTKYQKGESKYSNLKTSK